MSFIAIFLSLHDAMQNRAMHYLTISEPVCRAHLAMQKTVNIWHPFSLRLVAFTGHAHGMFNL